jgi:hypothetical protein
VAVLLVPTLAFSANKFAPSDAVVGTDNTVTIPLNIANDDGLMAIDIPLKFSEGVTLKEVNFENTRVADFDLKLSNIDNEKNIVIIGLVHQATSTAKPTLAAGEGPVANLVFEVDDATLDHISIEAVETQVPRHTLTFIYNTRSNPDQLAHDQVNPVFEGISVALSGGAGSRLPTSYALMQNYPNPFNPSTEIAYSLPSPGDVQLKVYNVLGQEVVTLIDEQMPAGEHVVTWDGRASDGTSVSSGVYFYRISANQFSETKKMMMLK